MADTSRGCPESSRPQAASPSRLPLLATILTVATLLLSPTPAVANPTGTPALLHRTLDAAGAPAASAHYQQDSSLGGLTTLSQSPSSTARAGYIAELYELAAAPVLTPAGADLAEGSTLLLRLLAPLDDATTLALDPAWFTWTLTGTEGTAALLPTGLLQTGNVYRDTTVTATAAGPAISSQNAAVTIRNTGADDLGLYAADGIDDTWQIEAFGLQNPAGAATADPSGTGQSNLFKYIAGLDPLDPAARFTLAQSTTGTVADPGAVLTLGPCRDNRAYRVLASTDLLTWTPLPGLPGSGEQRTLTDPHPGVVKKFYRVEITSP